jgi:hypothetical protein
VITTRRVPNNSARSRVVIVRTVRRSARIVVIFEEERRVIGRTINGKSDKVGVDKVVFAVIEDVRERVELALRDVIHSKILSPLGFWLAGADLVHLLARSAVAVGLPA